MLTKRVLLKKRMLFFAVSSTLPVRECMPPPPQFEMRISPSSEVRDNLGDARDIMPAEAIHAELDVSKIMSDEAVIEQSVTSRTAKASPKSSSVNEFKTFKEANLIVACFGIIIAEPVVFATLLLNMRSVWGPSNVRKSPKQAKVPKDLTMLFVKESVVGPVAMIVALMKANCNAES